MADKYKTPATPEIDDEITVDTEKQINRDPRKNLLLAESEVLEFARYLRGRKVSDDALEIIARGGGNVQTRLIAELPHLIAPEDRLAITQEFCRSQFKNRTAYDKKTRKIISLPDIRYHCVIHAPDEHNDYRNFHFHVVWSERPTDRIPDADGRPQWDFAVTKTWRDNTRHVHSHRPHKQRTDRYIHSRDWPKKARLKFADIVNAKLAERGIDQKYDPRSFKNMGLDIQPLTRVSRGEYMQEKAGKKTRATALIAERWDRMHKVIEKLWDNTDASPKTVKRFDREVKRWQRIGSSFAHMALAHSLQWRANIRLAKFHKGEAAIEAFILEKMRSRLDPPLKKGPVANEAIEVLKIQENCIEQEIKKSMFYRVIAAQSFDVLLRLEKKDLCENRPINFIYGDTLPNGWTNPKRLQQKHLEDLTAGFIAAAAQGEGDLFMQAVKEQIKTEFAQRTAERTAKAAAATPAPRDATETAHAPTQRTSARPSDDVPHYPGLEKIIETIRSAPIGRKNSTAESDKPAAAGEPARPKAPEPASTHQQSAPAPKPQPYLATPPKISNAAVKHQAANIQNILISADFRADRASSPTHPARPQDTPHKNSSQPTPKTSAPQHPANPSPGATPKTPPVTSPQVKIPSPTPHRAEPPAPVAPPEAAPTAQRPQQARRTAATPAQRPATPAQPRPRITEDGIELVIRRPRQPPTEPPAPAKAPEAAAQPAPPPTAPADAQRKERRRVLTPEEVRQRVLIAQRNRRRGPEL